MDVRIDEARRSEPAFGLDDADASIIGAARF